jgi:hypothetical protein
VTQLTINLGSWIALGMSLAALMFSVWCFVMIREIREHVLLFDPTSCRNILEECIKMLRQAEKKFP